ncbi:MAG TPA: MmcQ/YjbR family DNA-binding protein [Candidatus Angelobacter sp.]
MSSQPQIKLIEKGAKQMRVSDFRRIALSLPEATEGSHFGNADFRVGGKIFATLSLAKQGYGVLLLTPEQQAGMVEDEPKIFSAIPNGWGRNGATRVSLAKVSPDILKAALQTAWRRRAPKKLSAASAK